MGSISDNGNPFDQRTHIHGAGGLTGDNIGEDPIFIVVVKRNGLILIHSPLYKNVSIGRSHQNNISLSDPRFPRKAAEMILGPLPLLRKVVRSGEKSHEIVPVSPGEPFKIFPYTFCLLKTGDIFVNRYREKGRLKVSVKWVFIPSVAIVLAFLSIYHFSTALKIEGRESAATLNHTIEKKGHTPGSDKGISRKMLESTGDHQNTPEKIRIYNLKRIEDGDHPKNRGAILSRPNNRKDLSTISSEKKRVSDKPGIPPGEFEMHIQAASESIALGNPQEAGRTINPVLRHLSLEQESRLIQRLEPGMNSLFRKAYMLMEYDRAAARVTLEKIVRSGLRQLPSFEKARAILEAERKAEAVYGNATGTEND